MQEKEKRKIIVLGTHYLGSDTMKEVWAELSKTNEATEPSGTPLSQYERRTSKNIP